MNEKELPIIFNSDMVRAILEGRKSQTRRPCTLDLSPNGYKYVARTGEILCHNDYLPPSMLMVPTRRGHVPVQECLQYSPFGIPGDRLWVRENFAGPKRYDRLPPRALQQDHIIPQLAYFAVPVEDRVAGVGKTRPSIHMPRLCSRITLKVVRVWVERLHDISDYDALEEGIQETHLPFAGAHGHSVWHAGRWPTMTMSEIGPRAAFNVLWDKIYGKRPRLSSSENPWVWCCEFRCAQ